MILLPVFIEHRPWVCADNSTLFMSLIHIKDTIAMTLTKVDPHLGTSENCYFLEKKREGNASALCDRARLLRPFSHCYLGFAIEFFVYFGC